MRHDELDDIGRGAGAQEERLRELWEKLGDLPEPLPGPDVRLRFYSMLERQRAAERPPIPRSRFDRMVTRRFLRGALAVCVLCLCLTLGYLLRGVSSESTRLQNEVAGLRKLVVLSLLQQPQAVERLRGVDWSGRIEQPDQEVLEALIRTLRYDANLNVRLAAVDALLPAAEHATVRGSFAIALLEEKEPLVRMALIDALVAVKTRDAAEALRQIAQDGEVEQDVRAYAAQRLRTIL